MTVCFFALYGFIFLVTQYFQFVRGYGTLSTGTRILPVAVTIGVGSVVGARLAGRIGTRIVVVTGVTTPERVQEALERAFRSGLPACINAICDPEAQYPRSSILM